jgi:formylglycine-generating enzyme required for sulfatase activity
MHETSGHCVATIDPGPSANADDKAPMVSIPAGKFMMGSPAGVGRMEEHPQHEVTVQAFQLDLTEVTVAAYDLCVRAEVCRAGRTGSLCNEDRQGAAQHPINCVDWNQAVAYCAWLGKRLPTEEEWEYAARGTDGRTYAWGNDPPSRQVCWNRSNGTCAAGSFPAGDSPFGVHDMTGNVWEWTASGGSGGPWGKTDYSQPRDESVRVYRGSSWDVGVAESLRAAFREWDPPSTLAAQLGFRCAR